MITLEVADYCHNCLEFEPRGDRTVLYSDDCIGGRERVLQTVVKCTHDRRCQSIKKYIENQSKKPKGEADEH